MNILSDNYASPANSNLSSLLSQIRDDGPAYSDRIKRSGIFSRPEKNNDNARINQRYPAENENTNSTVSSDELQPCKETNVDVSEAKTNIFVWVSFSLIISVAILSVITLLKLDSRTSELEQSFSSYDASAQDSAVSQVQSKELSMSITNTNETLHSIQQELQHIKREYMALDEKYSESIANNETPQSNDVVLDNVGELKHEMLSLKGELQTLKNKLITINKNSKTTDNIAKNNGLTVNLASLTNKNKAEQVVEQLNEAGLFPYIQTVVIKGRQIYRLSVSGFVSREAAESFIHQAGKQYGLKDGWISNS